MTTKYKKEYEISLKAFELMASFNPLALKLMKRILPTPLLRNLKESPVVVQSVKNMFSKVEKKSRVKRQGWIDVIKNIKFNKYANAEVIWDQGTLKDLKESLQEQINFIKDETTKKRQTISNWNYMEYKVDYPSLEKELKVDIYYVKYLSDEYDRTILQSQFDPLKIIILLLVKLNQKEDEKNIIHYVKALNHIYITVMSEGGDQFPNIDLVTDFMESRNTSNSLSLELLLMLLNIISIKVNIDSIKHDILVKILIKYLKEIQSDNEPPTSVDLASLTLNILLKLVNSRTFTEKKLIRPIPSSILGLTENLNTLISVLLTPHDVLYPQIYPLLIKIAEINDLFLPYFYKTGLYYYIFAGTKEKQMFTSDAVHFVQITHNQQDFNPEEFGLTDKESFLKVFLPDAMINAIDILSFDEYSKSYYSDVNSPILIWNSKMREYLEEKLNEHLKNFDPKNPTPMKKVEYKEMENQLYLGGYYLPNLLLPDNTGYKIKNPLDLFNTILKRFIEEKDDEILDLLILTQVFLIMKHNINIKKYTGFEKCLNILGIYDKEEWDEKLIENCVGLVFILIKNNFESDFQQLKGENVLMSLGSSLFRNYKKTKEINLKLFEIIFEIFKKFDLEPYLKSNDINLFIQNILYILIKFKNLELFKLASEFILKYSKCEEFIQALWNKGILYFLLQNMLYIPSIKNEESYERTVSILSSKMIENLMNYKFVVSDVNLFIPGLNSNQNLIEKLHSDTESPDFIWNTESRKLLVHHLQKYSDSILNNDFQNEITYQKVEYTIFIKELIIYGIYLRVFNLTDHKNWEIPDPIGLFKELIKNIDKYTRDHEKLNLLLLSLNNLLNRVQERSIFFKNISEIEIEILFKVLSSKSEILLTTHLNTITLALKEEPLLDKLGSMNVLHYITFLMTLNFQVNLTQIQLLEQAERIEVCVDLIKSITPKNKILLQMNNNGMILYLLLIFIGVFPCEEKLRMKATVILEEMLIQSQEDQSTLNILNKILPNSITDLLVKNSKAALSYIEEVNESPLTIWNESTLNDLKDYLKREYHSMKFGEWAPKETFQYQSLSKELVVNDIYIRIYNEDKKYAQYQVKEDTKFLHALINKLLEKPEKIEYQYALTFAMVKLISTQNYLSSNQTFLECLNTIITYFEKTKSYELFIKIIELLYILSTHNLDVVKRLGNEDLILIFFDKIENNNYESLCPLILSLIRQSEDMVKSILNHKKDEILIKMLSQNLDKNKILPILKVLYGSQEEKKEILDQTKDITLPPLDSPLNSSLDLSFSTQLSLKSK